MNQLFPRAPLKVALLLLLAGCSILKNRDEFTLRDADAGPADGNVELGSETGMEDDRVPPDGQPDGDVPCADPAECGYRDFSSGPRHTCAIRREDNVLECWGSNRFGESFGPDATSLEVPTPAVGPEGSAVEGEIRAHDVVAGDGMTCFLFDDGAEELVPSGPAFCVGENENGQSGGANTDDDVTVPTRVPDTPSFIELGTRNRRVCGVTRTEEVWCWGFSGDGQLGDRVEAASPLQIPHVNELESSDLRLPTFAMTDLATCMRTRSGQVACFGNEQGELGGGGQEEDGGGPRFGLTLVPAPGSLSGVLSNIVSLSARRTTICAVDGDGGLLCWGESAGELIPGVSGSQVDPARVENDGEPISDAARVAFLEDALCYWDLGGLAFCRGSQSSNELGTGADSEPFVMDSSFATREVFDQLTNVSGSGSFCGLREGELICWGYAPFGQIPRDDLVIEQPTQIEAPVSQAGEPPASDLNIRPGSFALGERGSCLIAQRQTNAQPYCAGNVRSDGRGTAGFFVPFDGFELIPGAINRVGVLQGPFGGCAWSARGSAVCWGANEGRTLGGDGVFPSTGDQPNLSGITRPSMGFDHGCGIFDRELRCWGTNESNELGRPDLVSLGVEQAELDGVGVLARGVAAGRDFTCALLTEPSGRFGDDGEVACFGKNDLEQLGYRDDSTPSAVSRVANARQVVAGEAHACALLDNGQLWCWGSNDWGQLGRLDRSSRAPMRVDLPVLDGARISALAASNRSTCIGTEDGRVFCWGSNEHHQLGVSDPFSGGTHLPQLTVPGDGGESRDAYQLFGHPQSNGYCVGPLDLDRDGGEDVYGCWGNNNFRKFGVGESVFCAPGPVDEGCNVNRLSAR